MAGVTFRPAQQPGSQRPSWNMPTRTRASRFGFRNPRPRSEEGRVGEEGRIRGWPDHLKKKNHKYDVFLVSYITGKRGSLLLFCMCGVLGGLQKEIFARHERTRRLENTTSALQAIVATHRF